MAEQSLTGKTDHYDVVIIGSGLGSLACGYILAREGMKVCILEKQRVPGGCLQTFTRCGTVFDTGMHYIGALDRGQLLHRLFAYFDLNSRLKVRRLDENAYDLVALNGKQYKLAMGYDRFADTMMSQFPNERDSIARYLAKMNEVNRSADIIRKEEHSYPDTGYLRHYSEGIEEFIRSITRNQTLQNLFASMAPLYAGVKEFSPLYIPLMIHSTYLEGAYRLEDGGAQIAQLLSESISGFGGVIMKNATVTRLHHRDNKVISAEINGRDLIPGHHFISGIHPKQLLRLIEESAFRPAYRNRINSLRETSGMFTVYLSMKPGQAPYVNQNLYSYQSDDLWRDFSSKTGDWPVGYMVHFSPRSADPAHTDAAIILARMNWDEVSRWENTTLENRGDDYRAFKELRTEKLLTLVYADFPWLQSHVKFTYASTPLTYRDYTGTWEGSVYGIQKDFNNPMKTLILPRTHLHNLLLTGQNINVHGVVGVTIGSVLTCAELLGHRYLIQKIRHASEPTQ